MRHWHWPARCQQTLGSSAVIVCRGGKDYRAVVTAAFANMPVSLLVPFPGLPLGKSLQATKHAIVSGDPGFRTSETADDQSR